MPCAVLRGLGWGWGVGARSRGREEREGASRSERLVETWQMEGRGGGQEGDDVCSQASGLYTQDECG